MRSGHPGDPLAGRLSVVLGLLALGGLAWFLACALSEFRDRAWDDAFITYDYARCLAEGKGVRFNASDPDPTDGASSLLHVGLAAAAIRLGLDPLVSTRALSLVLFLAAPFILALVVARLVSVSFGVGLLCAAAAWIGLGLTSETSWHLAGGMDTILFLFVNVAATSWAVLFASAPSRPGLTATVLGPILLTLLTAARPEGLVLAASLLALVPILRWSLQAPAQSRFGSRLAWVAIAFVLIAGGLLAWKAWYFGHFLPNAYYVKSRNAIFGSSGSLLPGWMQVTKFLVLWYAPLVILISGWAKLLGVPARIQRVAALVLLPSTAIVLLYARAIHESAGGYRYEYFCLAVLYGCLAALLGAQWKRSPSAFGWILVFGASLVPALELPQLERFLRAPFATATLWVRHEFAGDALGRLGRDLGETHLGQNATILLSGAGQVPYFSRFRAIDWIGLNTTELSGRYERSLDQVWEYIDARRPDVVYSFLPPASPGVHSRREDPGFSSPSVQRSLAGRASVLFRYWKRDRVEEMFFREMVYLRDHYEFGAAYALDDDWALMAYVRRDSPNRAVLEEALGNSPRSDRQMDLKKFYSVDPRALR